MFVLIADKKIMDKIERTGSMQAMNGPPILNKSVFVSSCSRGPLGKLMIYRISGSHSGIYEELYLVRYDTV
jgi:hypothetical protein